MGSDLFHNFNHCLLYLNLLSIKNKSIDLENLNSPAFFNLKYHSNGYIAPILSKFSGKNLKVTNGEIIRTKNTSNKAGTNIISNLKNLNNL